LCGTLSFRLEWRPAFGRVGDDTISSGIVLSWCKPGRRGMNTGVADSSGRGRSFLYLLTEFDGCYR